MAVSAVAAALRCDPIAPSFAVIGRRFDAELASAVSEIFNNIALHAYGSSEPGEVVIELEPAHDRARIRISDMGKRFDIHAVPAPQLEALPEGGLGLHIAASCVDVLDYQPGPPNVWSLEKRYRPT